MVKLSEIIRKIPKEKSQDDKYLLSDVVKVKKNMESPQEIKKIYENAILRMKQIIHDLKEGKTIEGIEIVNIATKIVDTLDVDKNVLLSLVNTANFYENQEDYLYVHPVNSSILAAKLGLTSGYDKSELIDLCASTLLHDIGMLKIPEKIINKPSKLTKEEYNQIRKHPIYGMEFLNNIKDPPKSASEVVYQHHERIDGTGYPEGRREEEISEYAKIVAIVEVYEALTHSRPYHCITPFDAVKKIIQEGKDSFEPKLIKLFLNYMTPYPVGSVVLLSNNETGRVVSINENFPLRPVIEIVLDAEGKPPEKPKKINLTKSPSLHIEEALDMSNL